MNKLNKILLTIPSILGLSYMVTFMFPQEFMWLIPTMDAYYTHLAILQGLTIIQLIFLLRKLWSFKNLEKSKKSDWTWILILFNSIASLIFIWKRVDEFQELNNKTVPNNG